MQTASFEAVIAGPEFLDQIQEGVWVADSHGRIVFANRALARVLGYERAESLVAKPWRELMSSSEAARLARIRPNEQINVLASTELIRRDKKAVQASTALMRRQHSNHTWYVGVVLCPADKDGLSLADIAGRKLLDYSQEGVCLVVNQRIVYANHRMEEMTGYSSSQLSRISLERLFNLNARNPLLAAVADPKRSPTPEYQEVRVANRAGREMECELHIVPVNVSGTTALFFLLRDVSQLRLAERTQTDFIATVSHELRTPLAAIREAIGLLSDTVGPALEQRPRRYLEIAREELDRLNRMISNLVESSRVDAGKVTLKVVQLDIAGILTRALTNLSLLINKRGLSVEKTIPPDLPPVCADQDRLLQVLINLLDNAIKYSPAGGTIRVSAHKVEPGSAGTDLLPDTNYVQVDITDSGPGIPAEFISRVFRKFERVDPHGPGIGLGLHIVQSLIRMHHGRVWARSSFGEGTTFSFTLPAGEECA